MSKKKNRDKVSIVAEDIEQKCSNEVLEDEKSDFKGSFLKKTGNKINNKLSLCICYLTSQLKKIDNKINNKPSLTACYVTSRLKKIGNKIKNKLNGKLNDNFKEAYELFSKSDYKLESNRLTEKDYEFMNSLSAATMYTQPKKLHWVVISFFATTFVFIIWAAFADIDEISRGSGKVVPSGQNQILQNLEGGIISEILVKEGDFVEKDQILIRIKNEKSQSSKLSSEFKELSLQAETLRLQAEFEGIPFEYNFEDDERMQQFIENERKIFDTNKKQLSSQVEILEQQIEQKKSQLDEAMQSQEHYKISLSMIQQEVEMTEPMVQRGVRSQVDFLKLQREENEANQKYRNSVTTIRQIRAELKEIEIKIKEIYDAHRVKVGEEYSKKLTELKELQATSTAFADQVERTIVRSPSNGLVQKLHINTIGGAIKPAQELVEIVPTDSNLIVEVKVLPSDIAFIYQDQKAIVKFSAYDFAIYGGLNGKVINISADTITDKEENTYYLVRIQTERNYLGSEVKPMKIIPGMIADADIITGKKSVLDYILKPILKTKQYTFTER